ncbi:MAG: hypothetical protein SFU86_17425 [Pirellulaceae bacterium]|nr:hypothetical protein [Pirellulaceae bacterium]
MIRQLHPTVDVNQICREGTKIDEAVERAARDARLRHKQMGVPLVVWQDGKVVEIPPEEIVVDPPSDTQVSSS